MTRNADKLLACAEAVPVCTATSSSTAMGDYYSDALAVTWFCVDVQTWMAS